MISGTTRLVALLGHPVAHSLSPRMQNAAFAACGLDLHYVALDVPPERLEQAVRGLVALGFAGANVTAPHKLGVAALDLVETDLQSVSTLVLRYGLDVPGTEALRVSQLESDNPYNTRNRTGLTPTPIANPGLASMQAAAHPADVDYLFFVRKPDKVHHFFTASESEFYAKQCEYGFGCG